MAKKTTCDVCGEQMRMRYPGGDPENGPAMLDCRQDHQAAKDADDGDQDDLPRIRVSYEVITPESAEQGDAAERGWEDEDGEPMLDPEDEDDDPVENAIEFLRDRGCTEPSSSAFHPGLWYTAADPDINHRTGEAKYLSCHLVGFDPDEEREIYAEIYGNEHGADARSRAQRKWNRR